MAKVMVYTTDFCPFCEAAKELLKQRGVPFEEVRVSRSEPERWAELSQKSGMKTMPQIFHGDELIGGFDDLNALDKSKGLEHLKK